MRRTGYGTPLFLGVRRIAAECREVDGGGLRALWKRLRIGSLWITWYRLRVPSIEVSLTTAAAGRTIAEHLAVREDGGFKYRGAQGFLALPADPREYLRGRRRQAVRTNVGHARRMGLEVVSVAVDNWTPGKVDCRAPYLSPAPVERWMVVDRDGDVVADSILSVDADVALLHGLVGDRTHARWLLHTAIIERLCGNCRILLTNSDDAYELTLGTIHFQHLLGYEIARLRLPRRGPETAPPAASQPAALSWPAEPMTCGGPEPVKPGIEAEEIRIELVPLPVA